MTDLIRWEIKTWGQVGASLLSLATVLSALTGLWEFTRETRVDIVAEASADIVAGIYQPHGLRDLLFPRP
jgi:hypothetical protein